MASLPFVNTIFWMETSWRAQLWHGASGFIGKSFHLIMILYSHFAIGTYGTYCVHAAWKAQTGKSIALSHTNAIQGMCVSNRKNVICKRACESVHIAHYHYWNSLSFREVWLTTEWLSILICLASLKLVRYSLPSPHTQLLPAGVLLLQEQQIKLTRRRKGKDWPDDGEDHSKKSLFIKSLQLRASCATTPSGETMLVKLLLLFVVLYWSIDAIVMLIWLAVVLIWALASTARAQRS